MVVGDGLMARAFSAFRDSTDVVIFASGVSNSRETSLVEFDRESELLKWTRTNNPGALMVYFGTCSIEDPEQRETPYVRHKVEMETMLAASAGPWLVLRVPLAIGRNPRSRTLAQFLHERISGGQPFEVWEGAARYPIDVDDVFRIGSRFIQDPVMWNRRINVALRPFPVRDFVRAMESIVGRKANYTVVPKGRHYKIECPEILQVASELNLDLGERYLERVLQKYFSDALPLPPP
jgi:nucleoside-diphosphate-sugar epimerase